MAQPGVRLDIGVKVDMSEFDKWQPEQVAAFFKGVGECVAIDAEIKRRNATPSTGLVPLSALGDS